MSSRSESASRVPTLRDLENIEAKYFSGCYFAKTPLDSAIVYGR